MPSIGTQVYWHDTPNPTPPWASDEQRTRMITIARSLRHSAISPVLPHLIVGNVVHEQLLERIRHSHERRKLHNVGSRLLSVTPLLSPRCVVNTLLASLGVAALSVDDCDKIVRSVQSSLDQSDMPMVVCVEAIAKHCGLISRAITRDEMKHRRGTFFPSDLPPRQRVLFLCSKVEPLFVGCFTEWLPMGRRAGGTARRGVNGSMRIMCPATQPQPWHRRSQTMRRVDQHEVVCMYVAVPGDAGCAVVAAASGRSTKNAKKNGADKKKSQPLQKGATTSHTNKGDDNKNNNNNNTQSEMDPFNDADMEELAMLLAEEEERKEKNGEEDYTDNSDNDEYEDEDDLFFDDEELSLFDAGDNVANHNNNNIRKNIQPVHLEPSAGFPDPFAKLPLASNLIITAVQSSLKNIQLRSTATWTQRLLQGGDRQVLYNSSQAQQMAMMD